MTYQTMAPRRNVTRSQIRALKFLAILINFDISFNFQRIGENLIGTRGLYAFTELLKTGKPLHTLDISGECRPQGYKTFFSFSTQLSTKFILLINVKMPTIVGILTFISMIKTTSASLEARHFFICQYFTF